MSDIERILAEAIAADRELSQEEKANLTPDLLRGAGDNTKLLEAIAKNKLTIASQLIDIIDDLEPVLLSAADRCRFNKNTPLLLAIKKGQTALALKLIEKLEVATLNSQDVNGFAAIHHAAILRDNRVLRALIEKGADLSLKTGAHLSDGRPIFRQQVTASELYIREISEADLAYPNFSGDPSRDWRRPSELGRVFTDNPLYTDLHWHIVELSQNQRHPIDTTDESLASSRVRARASELGYSSFRLYQSLSVHENPYVRKGLNDFTVWRNAVSLGEDILASLGRGAMDFGPEGEESGVCEGAGEEGNLNSVVGSAVREHCSPEPNPEARQEDASDTGSHSASAKSSVSPEEAKILATIEQAIDASIKAMQRGHWLIGNTAEAPGDKAQALSEKGTQFKLANERCDIAAMQQALIDYLKEACKARKSLYGSFFEAAFGHTRSANTFFANLDVGSLNKVVGLLNISESDGDLIAKEKVIAEVLDLSDDSASSVTQKR